MSKKPIIVFEGIEGSGKSLHIKNVQRYLLKKQIKFISIREPGGSKNSEKIRKLILNNNSNFDKITDLLLYLASRNENIINIIKKNVDKKIILIDRFIDSTFAYQHYGMGISLSFIKKINDIILGNIKPNFTFLNLVNKTNLKIRLGKRKNLNRYDKFQLNFYHKVQSGFIRLSKQNKKKYLEINSNKDISANKKIILSKIDELL